MRGDEREKERAGSCILLCGVEIPSTRAVKSGRFVIYFRNLTGTKMRSANESCKIWRNKRTKVRILGFVLLMLVTVESWSSH